MFLILLPTSPATPRALFAAALASSRIARTCSPNGVPLSAKLSAIKDSLVNVVSPKHRTNALAASGHAGKRRLCQSCPNPHPPHLHFTPPRRPSPPLAANPKSPLTQVNVLLPRPNGMHPEYTSILSG